MPTATCAHCGSSLPEHPVVLNAGGLLQTGPGQYSGPTDQIKGFCSLWVPNRTGGVDLDEYEQGGQIEILFCRAECAREFLTGMVDRLEAALGDKAPASEVVHEVNRILAEDPPGGPDAGRDAAGHQGTAQPRDLPG